jgi:O-antigen/teichoic acid export membrane protein
MKLRISKNFLKSSLIYTLAGALPMASAVILLPFYVGYLSTSDFGALSIYFAFAIFVQLLTTYSFDTSLYIHFHEFKNDRKKLSSFTSSAFILMLAIGLCVGLVFTFFGELAFRNIFVEKSIAFYPYGMMAAVAGIFQALFKVYGNFLQSREKPQIYLWSNIVSFALIAGVTILGLKMYPHTLTGPIGGRLVAAVLSGLWALVMVFREFGFHFNFPLLRTSFSFNFYTFLYQFLQWVINYFDRIFMVFFLALDQVGVYDFAMKCLLIIEFILNGLHNSFYPKVVSTLMAQERKESTPEINRYYHGFISMIMLLICLCVFSFPWAIETFVSKPGYREAIRYVPYISLIYIFRAIRLFYAAPYGILKYTKPLSGIYISVSIVKISVMWLLIDRFGLYGVICASVLAAILEIALLRSAIGTRFTFRYNFLKIIVVPAVVFLMIAVLEPLFGAEAPNLLHLFYIVVCVVLLAWVYRNELKLIDPFNILR